MPKRVRTQTIVGGPQGEDAKLVVLMPTYGESRQYSKKLTTLERKINELLKQAEEKDITPDAAMQLATEIETRTEELTQVSAEYLSAHMVEWNWVDDEDKELPKPHNNMDVIDSLTNDEVSFIRDALNGTTVQQEESRKKLRT